MPRDFIDVFLGIPIGLFQTIVILGTPAFIVFYFTHSVEISFLACCLTHGFLLLFTVRGLTVASDGLHFHRILGSPKFLPWECITSVETAPRKELILRGWLWPLFPPREMTVTLSALHHYRITWDKGFFYFPPATIEEFEKHVLPKLKPEMSN
jgi:hypothetical protein